VAVTALAAGFVLGGAGLAIAAPAPRTNDDVRITLPVDQQLIEAHNTAAGYAVKGSPGVVSGNVIQAPIHVPINVCGNTISVVGLLNPTFGNTCVNK
jgi:ChpA-C